MSGQSQSFILLYIILLPAVFAALALLAPAKWRWGQPAALLLGFTGNLVLNLLVFGKTLNFACSWGGAGLEFSLRLYNFSGFILLSAAILSFLTAVYTSAFAGGKAYSRLFYTGMLLTLTMVNGAVLANNLLVMLFFWEAILASMFVMIMVGGKNSYRTSVKAVIIAGVTDLCMMLGIGLVGYLAKTLDMEHIKLPVESLGLAAFILLSVGAVSKAGSMPFHTWIPDAADDAPMPFLAFLPGTLEKLLGIYLLSRICMDLFVFEHGSPISFALMTLGAGTIIFAVMMALIQRDYKRLLSYHAISQVGYMILGIGSALPIGIVGGIFHMLNHAVYKCCLFLTSGAVEKQTGITDLNRLEGLGRKMPITLTCFIVAAASIAGFPMTNGFFSKELVFDSALESGLIFYIVAAAGAFFTAVSFLKLGHAAFFGKPSAETEKVREAPLAMLAPMLILAAACLTLGFGQSFMIEHVFRPFLGVSGEHLDVHTNWLLVGISIALLILAALDHYWGFKKTGRGLNAADHFHYAPVLHTIYGWAEKKRLDPYEVFRSVGKGYSNLSLKINDGISRCYDELAPRAINGLSSLVRRAHNGSMTLYVIWVLGGFLAAVIIFLML